MSWTTTKIEMTGPLAAPALTRVMDAVAQEGDEALIVGGAVRNALMGRDVSDVDIATTALPDQVIERATRAGLKAVPTGLEHGTITVVADGRGYEVTTLRRDVDTDGRRAKVEFGRDFIGDAHRRDFTINGLYARLDGTVFDPVNGLNDIAKRRVRFIGDPATRIREDYLRILRFFRFFGDYDEGEADHAALSAIAASLDGLETLSRERVRAELLKIISVRRADETMLLLHRIGVLPHVIPHPCTPDILVRAIALFPDLPPIARLAALLDMQNFDREIIRTRLRLSNDELRQLDGLNDALNRYEECNLQLDVRALRTVSFRAGKRNALAALVILAARHNHALDRQDMMVIDEAPQSSPFTGDMMLSLGFRPGPLMGELIKRAEVLWIDANMPSDDDKIRDIVRHAAMVN